MSAARRVPVGASESGNHRTEKADNGSHGNQNLTHDLLQIGWGRLIRIRQLTWSCEKHLINQPAPRHCGYRCGFEREFRHSNSSAARPAAAQMRQRSGPRKNIGTLPHSPDTFFPPLMAIWPHCTPLSAGVIDFPMSTPSERQSRISVAKQPLLAHGSDIHIDDARGTAGLSVVLATARALHGDVVVLAGDTFESNQLGSTILDRAGRLLAEADSRS